MRARRVHAEKEHGEGQGTAFQESQASDKRESQDQGREGSY